MKTRRVLASIAAVVGLFLIAGFALLASGHRSVSAAPDGLLGRSAGASATPGTSDEQAIVDAAFARFASRLGVDQATLDADFAASVNEALDQAVRDGKVTQAQADQVKATVAKSGLKGLVLAGGHALPSGGSSGDGNAVRIAKEDPALVAAWTAAATSLGYADPAVMKRDLASGKSLAALARARGVDVQQLRAAMLAAARSELDKAVRDGVLTQPLSDVRYRDIAAWTDTLINTGQH